MQNAIDKPGLAAHSLALEAAGAAIKLVMRLPAPLKPIAEEVIRSASSVPANLTRVGSARGGARHASGLSGLRAIESRRRARHPPWCSRSEASLIGVRGRGRCAATPIAVR